MNYIAQLQEELNALTATRAEKIAALDAVLAAPQAETRSLTADESVAFSAATAAVSAVDADIEIKRARLNELEQIAARTAALPKTFAIHVDNKTDMSDIGRMSHREIEDTIAREVESRNIDPTAARVILRRHAKDIEWARSLAIRSTDVYESAWVKMMTGRQWELSAEERAAVAVGTNTQGGYLSPTHLDPTIIITNTGSRNAIRNIARVVTLTTGSVWHGVSSAGVTASWDGELVEVSDDSPSFVGPSVTTYQAQALVQASFAALEDTNFANDVLMMFSDARDRLEGAAHCTGSGSGQPDGIFTVIAATSSRLTTSTTAATIGLVDLQTVRRAVGVRFRERGTWVLAPVYNDAIKALGTAISASYSTDITQAPTQRLLGNSVVETDDAPTTQTTTAKDPEVIFGDFSNYVIADKPGSFAVEYIPNMFATANNLPDGRRAWFAHWRTGADSVNSAAFQLLVDKTSA